MNNTTSTLAAFFKNHIVTLVIAAIALSAIVTALFLAFPNDVDCEDPAQALEQRFELDGGFQISANYLHRVAKWNACTNPTDTRAQAIYQIVSDIEIKFRSYAMLNKIAWIVSIVTVLVLILIPAVNSYTGSVKWIKKSKSFLSPAQYPAITLLAAFVFSMYGDYKVRQAATENLMRYAIYTEDSITDISTFVIERLTTIDSGFEFSEYLPGEQD